MLTEISALFSFLKVFTHCAVRLGGEILNTEKSFTHCAQRFGGEILNTEKNLYSLCAKI